MNLGITVDFREVEKMLGDMKTQAPFILQRTINNTLLAVQSDEIAHISKRFTIRKPAFLKRSVKMMQFAKKNNLTGILGLANVGQTETASIFGKFEDGGIKTAQQGRNVAVPQVAVLTSKSGIIGKAKRPRNLARSFKVQTARGELLLQRKGRGKNSKVSIAYILTPSVRIDNRLQFVATGFTSINNHLDVEFDKAFESAMATAK